MIACAVAGLAAAAVAAAVTEWQLSVLAGWIVTASTFLAWLWGAIGRLDAVETSRVATREDDSRAATRAVLVVASVVSLVAVVTALHRATRVSVGLEVALTASAMLAVVLSWLVVHSVFVLRYAHLFYGGQEMGGIEFPGDEPPSYRDFAYLGFTVGMTFQVSDTAIRDREIRATVLRHALLSYLFGTAIIASTINVLAGLIG